MISEVDIGIRDKMLKMILISNYFLGFPGHGYCKGMMDSFGSDFSSQSA